MTSIRSKCSKQKKTAAAFTALLLALISSPVIAYAADSDDSIIKILNQFPLERNSLASNIIRQIGWQVVIWLHWFVKGLEEIVYGINGAIGGFFSSANVLKLSNEKVLPIAIMLIGVIVLFIGIQSIIKPQNLAAITSNFIVGVVIAIALPTLLKSGYDFTNQAIAFLNSDSSGKTQTLSDRILVDNVTDMTQYDVYDFKNTALKDKSSYTKSGADISKITKIDATELVTPDGKKHPKVWQNKIGTDSSGKQVLNGLNTGQYGFINIPLLSEYYYRWNIDFFNILTTLIITAVALIFSGVKIARLIYELALHQTMTQVIALLDVFTAQRLKKCIQSIISTLGTLFAIFFMLQIYLLGMAYIAKVSNLFLRFLLMVALAWSVIDGPNLFEQILGVDAGLHGALRTMYGLKAAGSAVAGGVALAGGKGLLDSLHQKGVIGTAKSAISKMGGAAGGAGGMAAGAVSGAADNHRRYAAVRNGKSNPAKAEQTSSRGNEKSAAAGTSYGRAESVNTAVDSNAGQIESPSAVAGQKPEPQISQTAPLGHEESQGSESYAPPVIGQEPQSQTASTETVGTSTALGKNSVPQRTTLGGTIRSMASQRVKQSSAVQSARRMYALTRNSSLAHGSRRVEIEQRAHQKVQASPASHSQAVREAKHEIRQEKRAEKADEKSPEKSWAEQEVKQEKNGVKK